MLIMDLDQDWPFGNLDQEEQRCAYEYLHL